MLARGPRRRGSAEEVVMRSLARWCVRHRLAVLGLWLMVLAGAFLGQSALGSHYATSTRLSGTPSAAAATLLQRAVPGQSGDTEQIVFQARTGTVTTPAVPKRINGVLGRCRTCGTVSGVTWPYTRRAQSRSRDGASRSPWSTSAGRHEHLRRPRRPVRKPGPGPELAGPADQRGRRRRRLDQPASSSHADRRPRRRWSSCCSCFGAVLPALLPLIGTGIALTAGTGGGRHAVHSVSMASFTPSCAPSSASASGSTTRCSS